MLDSRTLSLYFEDCDPNDDDGDNDDEDHGDDFHHLKMILTPMLYIHLLSSDYDDRVRMMMMVVMAVIVVMVVMMMMFPKIMRMILMTPAPVFYSGLLSLKRGCWDSP